MQYYRTWRAQAVRQNHLPPHLWPLELLTPELSHKIIVYELAKLSKHQNYDIIKHRHHWSPSAYNLTRPLMPAKTEPSGSDEWRHWNNNGHNASSPWKDTNSVKLMMNHSKYWLSIHSREKGESVGLTAETIMTPFLKMPRTNYPIFTNNTFCIRFPKFLRFNNFHIFQ